MLMLNTAAYLLGKPYYCNTSICCAKIYTYVCVCVHVCVCVCVCVYVCVLDRKGDKLFANRALVI